MVVRSTAVSPDVKDQELAPRRLIILHGLLNPFVIRIPHTGREADQICVIIDLAGNRLRIIWKNGGIVGRPFPEMVMRVPAGP